MFQYVLKVVIKKQKVTFQRTNFIIFIIERFYTIWRREIHQNYYYSESRLNYGVR